MKTDLLWYPAEWKIITSVFGRQREKSTILDFYATAFSVRTGQHILHEHACRRNRIRPTERGCVCDVWARACVYFFQMLINIYTLRFLLLLWVDNLLTAVALACDTCQQTYMSVNVGRELVPVTTAIIIIYLFIPVLDREKERKTGEREKREKVRREKESVWYC